MRGPRGVEPGVVLCEPGAQFAPALSTEGELLRTVTPDDDSRLAGERIRTQKPNCSRVATRGRG